MKSAISIFIALVVSLTLQAQEETEYFDFDGPSIAIVPSAFANQWNGYQLKFDYVTRNHYGFDINIGYLYGKKNEGLYSGLRIKPTFRYYLNSNSDPEKRIYIGLGYLYRRLSLDTQGDLKRFGGQFFERVTYKSNSSLHGSFLEAGNRSKINDKFWMDFSIGLGYGEVTRTTPDKPEGSIQEVGSSSLIDESTIAGISEYAIAFFHISLGMRL